VDAGEGEFGKSFRRGRIKTIDWWWRRIFSRNCGKRDKQQNGQGNFHVPFILTGGMCSVASHLFLGRHGGRPSRKIAGIA
jgi:hypothetical protein